MLDGSNCSFFPVFVNSFISRDDSSFSILQGSCAALKNDTIDFNVQIVVARKKYLDCAAHVEHEFYLDTAGRCVVWRLYSAYGGCHVMNEKSFIFALPKPPPGYAIRLEEYTLPFED